MSHAMKEGVFSSGNRFPRDRKLDGKDKTRQGIENGSGVAILSSHVSGSGMWDGRFSDGNRKGKVVQQFEGIRIY